jgi:hypothetical protein
MKKDSFYFPHDYNSRNDVKCLFLRQQLGMEGYGIFWFLIECLADSGGTLPLKIVPVLAMQMQVPDVKVSAVIHNFDLFQIQEDNIFFSNRLNHHLHIRKTLSDKGKEGAIIRWGNRGANGEANTLPIGKGNAKERKGKERKRNIYSSAGAQKTKTFKDWSKDDLVENLKEFKETYDKDVLNEFYKHWVEPSPSGKMRLQLEKTWDTNLRLQKWMRTKEKYSK